MQRDSVNGACVWMNLPRHAVAPALRSGADRRVDARLVESEEALRGSRSVRQLIRGAEGGGKPQLLYGAFGAGGKVIAAAMMVPQAGGTGLVFTSRPHGRFEEAGLVEALEVCCDQAPRDRVKLAQSLLSRGEDTQAQALRRSGFTVLADLAYMEARVPRDSCRPTVPPGVTMTPWDDRLEGKFLAAMEASYRHTRDCPGLAGIRDTPDVLAGHRATGVFDPALWTLVTIDGQPAGVLLLNRVPAAVCVELVYLGLAPEFRGRSLGVTLMRCAFGQCAAMGEGVITLAVDTANTPAVCLYRRFGFYRTATKTVMVRPLPQIV